jgi:hypothetical protein
MASAMGCLGSNCSFQRRRFWKPPRPKSLNLLIEDDANFHVFESAHRRSCTRSNRIRNPDTPDVLSAAGYVYGGSICHSIRRDFNAQRFEETSTAVDDMLSAHKRRDATPNLVGVVSPNRRN